MIVFVKVVIALLILYVVVKFVFLNIPTLPYRWYKKLRIWHFKRINNKENGRFDELIKIFEKDLSKSKK
jgi:exopolysaccharide biosynthesis protein